MGSVARESYNVAKIVGGSLKRVLFVHLDPDEDLYGAIAEVAKRERITTGVAVTVTGALSSTRLSTSVKAESVESPPGCIELEGTAEVNGSGYFGITDEAWSSPISQIVYKAGEPFVHVHLTACVAGNTYTGHLLEGCRVRSLHPSSHFIVVLAEVDGVRLSYHRSAEPEPGYPNGVPYYQLDKV